MLKKVVRAGVIAALYFVLTFFLSPISFGPVQVRISEALTLLPFIFPEAIFGVTLGCIIANLSSPFGVIDVVLGSFLTFVASVLTWLIGKYLKKKMLAPLPPILLNAFGVAFYVVFLSQLSPLELEAIKGIGNFGASFSYIFKNFAWYPYFVGVVTIGLGESIATYGIGIPLLTAYERRIKR